MKFNPKTEKEINDAGLWPNGVYAFKVMDAEERVSKAGNDMIVLKLKVYNNDGGCIHVDDYLLESMAFKLRHAAEACGLLPEYEAGDLSASNFDWAEGRLRLKIQRQKDGTYQDKNVVADYVVGPKANATSDQAVLDDKVPF